MIEKIKKETMHYAKRQLTWFRKNKETIWLDGEKSTDENVCGRCLENKYAYVDTEDEYYPIEKVNTCVCGQTYLIEEGDKGLCPDCVEEETGDE